MIERLEPETETVLESKELRLDELQLAPLDFVYAVEGGQGGQQAEIEQRILYTIMRKPDGFAPGSLLRINPNRKPEWKVRRAGIWRVQRVAAHNAQTICHRARN